MKKTNLFQLLLLSTLVACSTNTVNQGNFTISSIETSPSPSSRHQKGLPEMIPDNNTKGEKVIEKSLNENKELPNFDFLPPEDTANDSGHITVIYKNSYKIRNNKITKKLESLNTDISEIEDILNKNGLSYALDLGNIISSDDKKLDKMQTDYFNKNKVDIPHLRSIHYYQLDKSTDTKRLCKELMKLPYVRLAYPTPHVTTSYVVPLPGTTKIPRYTSTSQFYSSIYPSDSSTANYWFNEHEAFRARDYFTSLGVAKPTIAVVDTGFDPYSPELNLLPGFSMELFPIVKKNEGVDCPSNSCLLPDPSSNLAHGNAVSHIAAAKTNGSNGDGIMPASNILPVKLQEGLIFYWYTAQIAGVINEIAANYSVDAINISLALDNPLDGTQYPLSFDSTINSAISYAFSQNKPVVLSAGNKNQSLIPPNNYSSDAIVVGGTMQDTNPVKYTRWKDPNNNGIGTNYFNSSFTTLRNPISLAAAANNIGFFNYNRSTNTRSWLSGTSGTSWSTPMVAATIAAMRKINPSLNAYKLKDILIHSSNVRRYDNTATPNIIGYNLEDSFVNVGGNSIKAGIRDLNIYNAFIITKHITNPAYTKLARLYNMDDVGVLDQNPSPNTFVQGSWEAIGYMEDQIFGVTSLGGSYLNYADYNSLYGCSLGYQAYSKNSSYYSNSLDLIYGVADSTSYSCTQNAWNYKINVSSQN